MHIFAIILNKYTIYLTNLFEIPILCKIISSTVKQRKLEMSQLVVSTFFSFTTKSVASVWDNSVCVIDLSIILLGLIILGLVEVIIDLGLVVLN